VGKPSGIRKGGERVRKAKNKDEAFSIQEQYDRWVQWKGTDVKCEYVSHVDATLAYPVKCPECGAEIKQIKGNNKMWHTTYRRRKGERIKRKSKKDN